MITIIAIIIIMYFIGILFDHNNYKLLPFLFGLAGMIVGFALTLFLQEMFPTEKVLIEEHEIYALKDASSVKGANHIISGKTEEELVFYYVTKEKGKGKHIEKVDAESTYIIEGDYHPTVKLYEERSKGIGRFFTLKSDKYTEFYLPENSIITDYVIDLE